MSTSTSGTTYTSSVSGITITSGGAENTIAGGSENPICISTSAIVETGAIIANTKRLVPNASFFMMFPPLAILLPFVVHNGFDRFPRP
jgi:hypothetical protein